MINNMGLLHYPSENTYKNICKKLNLNEDNGIIKDNYISYSEGPILRINPFNIVYKQFGHIWFLDVYMNFPKFGCKYIDFEKKLYDQYKKLFGKNVMNEFPVIDNIVCNYVEYLNTFDVGNADDIVKYARQIGCPPIKYDLDFNDLSNEKKPHGKIDISVSKKDKKHIETLICCFGTGLKKRIKEKSFHRTVGIKVSKIVDEQTEKEIVNWALKRNNFDNKL